MGLVLALAGASTLFYFYYQTCKRQHQRPFKTENPQPRPLVQFVTATGNLKALDQISVGSLVVGRIVQILAEDNDIVKKDQILTIIDNGIGDTAIKKQKALLTENIERLKYQKQFYKRQTALYKSGQLSKNLFEQYTQDYEVAVSKVAQTKADLELETQTYNNLFIKSPDDGIVIAKKVNLGQMVTSQFDATILFEIAKDLHCMEAHIDVDEADIGMVKEGQEASFAVDAFPKERFTATVKRIQYQAKIVDNVVTYAAVLNVANPELRLRPGMTTNVDIKVASADQALSVSNKAFRISAFQIDEAAKKYGLRVYKLQAGPKAGASSSKALKTKDYLWVLEDPKTIKQIEVKLGINDGKYTQISNGISPQTNIIVDLDVDAQENILLTGAFGRPGGIGSK